MQPQKPYTVPIKRENNCWLKGQCPRFRSADLESRPRCCVFARLPANRDRFTLHDLKTAMSGTRQTRELESAGGLSLLPRRLYGPS